MSSAMQRDIPEGYKQTEVGVIPEDWAVSTIGENTRWSSGGTPNRKRDDYWEGSIPWISGSTLKTLEISTSDQFITAEGVTAGSNMAPVNSTLLLVRGSALHKCIRAGLVTSPVSFNQDVKSLMPTGSVHPRFLTFFIKGMESELLKLVSSAGNSAGVLDTLLVKNFKFLKPSFSEQTAIANALSDVDALITSLENLITKKRAIKTAAMQQLLTGKMRLPPFDKTHTGYKQTELGEIPGDWSVVKLGNVLERIIGGGTPGRSNPAYWGDEIPWVTVKDFATFDPELSQEYITKIGLQNSSSNLVPEGTLITSTRMALGKAVIYDVPVAINQDLKALFPKKIVSTKFLYYWFEDNAEIIDEMGSGSTVKGLSLSDLKSIEFRLPSIEEQTAITKVLDGMDKDIGSLERRLTKTQQLKQGMMQELLTGKTRLV
ncbi:MAG: restriction endonuclease subunit S [Candidatus Sedimenticola sp. (ex Thyasira tokunagai)]